MRIARILTILFLSATLGQQLWAEDKTAPDANAADAGSEKFDSIQQDLQGLRNDILVLRDDWTNSFNKNTATTTRVLKIGAVIQSRFSVYENPGNTINALSNSIDIPFAVLNLTGNLKQDIEEGRNLNYALGLSFVNGTATLTDANISYYILPSLDVQKPLLQIIFGQQKKPFGLEAQATEDKAPTIKTAQFVNRASLFANGNGVSGFDLTSRDVGLALRGDLFPVVDYTTNYRVPLFEYAVGVFNGNGANLPDNNNWKDLIGRIVINAPVEYSNILRGLSLGGSAFSGKTTLTINGVSGFSFTGLRERYGLDLSYVNTPIGFTAEVAKGRDQKAVGTAAHPAFQNPWGEAQVYTVFYNWGEQFIKSYTQQDLIQDWWPTTYQPFFRLDSFDPDSNHQASPAPQKQVVLTYGLNIFFAQTTKVQFNYNKLIEDQKQKPSDEYLVQFQYGF
jgi:hypothetical protein